MCQMYNCESGEEFGRIPTEGPDPAVCKKHYIELTPEEMLDDITVPDGIEPGRLLN